MRCICLGLLIFYAHPSIGEWSKKGACGRTGEGKEKPQNKQRSYSINIEHNISAYIYTKHENMY